jgi:hypothetical protein
LTRSASTSSSFQIAPVSSSWPCWASAAAAADWGRRSAHGLSGPGGEPLELGGDLDLRKLNDDDLEQLRELYTRAAR